MKRLGAIKQAVLHADLLEQQAHLRQRIVGRAEISCHELDGSLDPEQLRRPPRFLAADCFGHERTESRSRPIEPATMRIDQRSPRERIREPAAHLQPLFDRVAALLDQPYGEVAMPGMELGQREIAEPFSCMGLIAVVTRPLRFADVPLPSALEIVDALKPDERNGMRVRLRTPAEFKGQSALHQVGSRCLSEHQVGQAEIDQQGREHLRITISVHLPNRSLSALLRADRIGGHADKDKPRRDPGAACWVLARHLERLLQVTYRQPNRPVIPLDLGQHLQPLRLQGGRHPFRLRLLGQAPRLGDIARSQQCGRLSQRPPHQGIVAVRRRELPRRAEQFRRRVERATQDSLPARVFDLGGGRLVRLSDTLEQVASPLLRISHDLREAAVEDASTGV